jgi:hypothetical protein
MVKSERAVPLHAGSGGYNPLKGDVTLERDTAVANR